MRNIQKGRTGGIFQGLEVTEVPLDSWACICVDIAIENQERQGELCKYRRRRDSIGL